MAALLLGVGACDRPANSAQYRHVTLPPSTAATAPEGTVSSPSPTRTGGDDPTPADMARGPRGSDFILPASHHRAPGGGVWRTLDWSSPREWRSKGAVITVRLSGKSLSELSYVYLPPQYFDPVHPRRNLPILEAFAGFPGRADTLVRKMKIPDEQLRAVRAGRAQPMVIVFLRPGVTTPWDTECTDVPHGPQALTYFSSEVPALVRDRFGLTARPGVTLGESTGGYCAAKIAMFDPADWRGAVAMSGYYTPATDPTTRHMFDDTSLRQQNDLQWRMEHLPVPNIGLLLCTGADDFRSRDDGTYVVNRWYHLLRPPIRGEELVLDHGGHDFPSFVIEMPYALSWLSRQLPGHHSATQPPPAHSTLHRMHPHHAP